MGKKHPYSSFKTSNGMPIHLYEVPSLMSMHFLLFVKVGSSYENLQNTGISHLIEHLSFSRTKNFATHLERSQELDKIGAKYNAWTSTTNTRYWINLPSVNTKRGIEFLYEFVYNPLIEKSDLEEEKSVILSEYGDFWHNPDKRFGHESWVRRFKDKKHPYTFRPLGLPESVKKLTTKDVLKWRNKYYTPKNMFLVAAGNSKIDTVKKGLEKTFSKEKPGRKQKGPKFDTDIYSGFNIFHRRENRPQIKFNLSFPTFGYKQAGRKEKMILNILSDILAGGPSSRLYQRLRKKESLVYQINSSGAFLPSMGDIVIYGSAPKDKLITTLRIIKEELDTLIKNGVRKKEVDFSKKYFAASQLMSFDNPLSICYFFGYQMLRQEKIWFPEDYVNLSNQISKKLTNKMIKEVFDYEKLNISLMGDISEKNLKKIKGIFD